MICLTRLQSACAPNWRATKCSSCFPLFSTLLTLLYNRRSVVDVVININMQYYESFYQSRTSSFSSNSTPEKPQLSFGIDVILSPTFGMKRPSPSSTRSNSPIQPYPLEPLSLAAQLMAVSNTSNSAIERIQQPPKATTNSRARTVFTEEQLDELENAFGRNQYVIGDERIQLADRLCLGVKQVKIWFQNRRIKHRRRKTH